VIAKASTRVTVVARPLPLLACAAALGCLLMISPVHAQDPFNGTEPSTLVVSDTATMRVSAALFGAAGGATAAADVSSPSSKQDQALRISTGILPDMQVESITHDADGGRSVLLADTQNATNSATLHWPQREDNPASNFVQGQTVAFTPSPQGKGWMLRAEDGAVLTFVPVIEAAQVEQSGKR